ncbi:alpha-2-macroglobulin family protein [Candidatus Uabimicrobium amorphum]|uniref:Alpha-2-macroglobulin n=1 Tax=Uabimicrobium amorphum TaxID=2596890 RepID=A0A5S9IU04_UABAM|nr:MG2 domain-containing protein [Candidatus Uabimicrobium amorphum]BBM88123.1 alpha-2-macroglobulin [Candidatus Uabimicrobium amorphum]
MKLYLSLLFVCFSCIFAQTSDPWAEVSKLEKKQKYKAALKKVDVILDNAQQQKNLTEWRKSLIRKVTLQTALHGYETSVRTLYEEAWPHDGESNSILNMFCAHTLEVYYYAYRWEINNREKVASAKDVDLKKWSKNEIFKRIHKHYYKAYQVRYTLGKLSVKDFKQFIRIGGYPERVRGTMRDFLCYSWAGFIASTQTWTPQQSREKYRIDFEHLLKASDLRERTLDDILLSDVHPILKLVHVLDDVYFWSIDNGRVESALESQLEKIRLLKSFFGEKHHKEKMAKELSFFLEKYSSYPWWAAGMYELAKLQQEQQLGVAAHTTAVKAVEKYPESLGGKKCLTLQKTLEAPAFNIISMGVDHHGEKSLRIQHKNMQKLFFRAYMINFDAFLKRPHRYPGSVYTNDLRQTLDKQRPTHSWSVDLEDLKDFEYHNTYTTAPMKRNGFFAVFASADENFSTSKNAISSTYMLISNMVVLENRKKGGWEAWIVDGKKGTGVAGATVKLYQYNYNVGARLIDTRKTSLSGTAFFRMSGRGSNYFMVAEKDNDVSFDPNTLYFYPSNVSHNRKGSFVYTDRSIYRPLQEIMCKVVTFDGNSLSGKYQAMVDKKVKLSLLDPNWKEVETKTVVTNSYGTASESFTVPQGRLLGLYRLRAVVDGKTSYANVRVEEYKRPTFEVELQKPKEELRLNNEAQITGNARYYFGLPLTTGKVFYRVTRVPVYPYWYWWYYRDLSVQSSDEVASGYTQLDTQGEFKINFTPEANDNLPNKEQISYRFEVYAEITDEGGETRNSSSTYNIGFVAVKAEISLNDKFVSAKETAKINIHLQDLNGVARAGEAQYSLFRVKQPQQAMLPKDLPFEKIPGKKYTPGDLMRPRWEHNRSLQEYLFSFADGEQVKSGSVTHGKNGKANLEFSDLTPGVYRIRYNTKDKFGSAYATQKEFIVADNNARVAVPVFLIPKQNKVSVGGEAVFFLGSGISDQPLSVEVHQNGHMLKRMWIDDASQTRMFKVKVSEKHRGGFSVRIHGVHDYQYYSLTENILVPWDNKELQLNFATFRDVLRPGQKETWTVQVKGPNAEDVAAEVLAYMYDRSLDFFAPHTFTSPATLYPAKYGVEYTRHGLFTRSFYSIVNKGWYTIPAAPSYYRDQFMAFRSYGVGGPGRRQFYRVTTRPEETGPAIHLRSEESLGEEGFADDSSVESGDLGGAVPEGNTVLKQQAVPRAPKVPAQKKKGEEPRVRSNFSETAFFLPHIVTKKGVATIEFEIPDSVTEWKVYVHAITSDLKYMSMNRTTATRKDLMVRPYVPRFFREGDKATLKAVINNATAKQMNGKVTLRILDRNTQKDRSNDFSLQNHEQKWTCAGNGSTNVSWSLTAPSKLGEYAFKVVAVSDNVSDGELRPVPVLPSRIHLSQSRFVTLKNNDMRIMEIKDLRDAEKDASLIHDSLVVNLNGQLIYTVLQALPFLTEYPYECVEQTMNRFVCTGMVTSMYDQYPAMKKMAEEFAAKRDTKYAKWNAPDANRKMALAETPWLVSAEGGSKDNLINVLDPKIANYYRQSSLDKLRKAQLNNGGFPWWTGGPSSAYMTLYLLSSFARALEFKVDIPQDMIKKAWTFMGQHFRDYYEKRMVIENYGYEFITFLNYVLSCYDAKSYQHAFSEKQRWAMLEYSVKHWKDHSPYIKAMLSLTLKRMKRSADAIMVMDSIMDSAITKQDQGTFWAPEDRGWLWYNDTIESHAFILRALMEVQPYNDKHLDGLVLWLLLNKKMNQWKSTRATAEVIYSLVTFMKQQGSLAVQEKAIVHLGGNKNEVVFRPDTYEGGQKQIVVEGKDIQPETMAKVTIEKEGKGYMFASMNWHYSTEKLPDEARGDFLQVTRKYFVRKHQGKEYVLTPLEEVEKVSIGEQLEVHLSIRCKHPMEYVHLRDPRGAGFEPENSVSRHRWEYGIVWYEEIRDSGANFFFERLPQGEYNFTYRVRANMNGDFRVGPATLQSMYAPEFSAFSSGKLISVK